MNINPVSFSATSSAFQDLVSKPQTYKENPMPASRMDSYNGKTQKKKHTLLKIVGIAAAIAGALALGAKGKKDGGVSFFTEKLSKMEKKDSLAYKALDYMNKAGSWILEKGTKVINSVKGLFKKGEQAAEAATEKGQPVTEAVAEKGQPVTEAVAEVALPTPKPQLPPPEVPQA